MQNVVHINHKYIVQVDQMFWLTGITEVQNDVSQVDLN